MRLRCSGMGAGFRGYAGVGSASVVDQSTAIDGGSLWWLDLGFTGTT